MNRWQRYRHAMEHPGARAREARARFATWPQQARVKETAAESGSVRAAAALGAIFAGAIGTLTGMGGGRGPLYAGFSLQVLALPLSSLALGWL